VSEKRIMVGFSGGVDSAVTALLLRDQGYVVRCAMMSVRGESGQGCGAAGDVEAAGRVADKLGLPFRVFDCSRAYREAVLENFRREYLAGRTPNPCVVCNPRVKFTVLPALAREAGWEFDRIATGHYARIERIGGQAALLRGMDRSKDQSYFLYRLPREVLERVMFPLGTMEKRVVREIAREHGLEVFDKPDSQDFYHGDYAEVLGCGEAEGEIVTLAGEVVGKHSGYWRFTPGQRRGLRVAHAEALYVLRLEPATNRVVVGSRKEGLGVGCVVTETVFADPGAPASLVGKDLMGRLRSAQPLRAMTVARFENGELEVRFAEPVQGVAPGQSLVLYDGERVVGGGMIQRAILGTF
jgi:tRNA-specific 2-thiouridylase